MKKYRILLSAITMAVLMTSASPVWAATAKGSSGQSQPAAETEASEPETQAAEPETQAAEPQTETAAPGCRKRGQKQRETASSPPRRRWPLISKDCRTMILMR